MIVSNSSFWSVSVLTSRNKAQSSKRKRSLNEKLKGEKPPKKPKKSEKIEKTNRAEGPHLKILSKMITKSSLAHNDLVQLMKLLYHPDTFRGIKAFIKKEEQLIEQPHQLLKRLPHTSLSNSVCLLLY